MSTDTSVDNHPEIQSENHVVEQTLACFKCFIKRLIARKPMRQIEVEIQTHNRMKRTLNWIELTGIGLGSTIGK